ncbi:unnamed protein product [Calypogeia fissa]
MGDHERSGIRKRLAKGKKALYQRLSLLSVRRPLGVLSQYWIVQAFLRAATKYIPRLARSPTRQISCRGPILQDPALDPARHISCRRQILENPTQPRSSSAMNFPDSREEHMIRPPGTELGHDHAASPSSRPTGRCGIHQAPVGSPLGSSPTSTVGSSQSFEEIGVANADFPQSPQFRRGRVQSAGSPCGFWEPVARGIYGGNVRPNSYAHEKINGVSSVSTRIQPSQFNDPQVKFEFAELKCELAGCQRKLQAARNETDELKGELNAARTKVYELESHLRNVRKPHQSTLEEMFHQKHDENISLSEKVQDLSSRLTSATEELEKACARLKSGKPQEGHSQHNAICGSYADESATPSLLNMALSNAKAAVVRFQKGFSEAIKHRADPASLLDLLQPDAHFARNSHINYAVRATVYEVFFEGFENESFYTSSGVSRFLDPDVRLVKFYEYYRAQSKEAQNHSSDLGDPQFEAFCETKVPNLWRKFNLRMDGDDPSMQVACLEALGGSQLVSSFRAAAINVWLLHKLAFSFEPPACIFRVGQGAGVDLDYMEPVVNLEDSKRFVNEVGFMIAPGLRVRKTVLRCEIYLSGGSSTA